ncbi:hypothetical protein QOL99_05655 [Deinococcus sp. MIMF12]|uniref:Uncharacterized protein n=1 Tax=Deinococcus rhizophilus TaxID=3049544 RepID=A0ABT7JF02_9DEIO|nr:hypothetical protein [Deinococcus rhizophilus]MDL2343635.1 hypothetical protein [Deinococcus rhizophilus]
MPALSEFTLYHRAVRDVRGDRLLPLSALRDTYPDVYTREAAKYAGREELAAERVLPLGCGWGDVLFFSPVHPGPLLEAVRASGREVPPLRFWTLRADALNPAWACVKRVRPWPDGRYIPPVPEDYGPYDAPTLARVSKPPAATLARLRTLPTQAPLILWSDVPHVLYRGTVPLSALGEVRV